MKNSRWLRFGGKGWGFVPKILFLFYNRHDSAETNVALTSGELSYKYPLSIWPPGQNPSQHTHTLTPMALWCAELLLSEARNEHLSGSKPVKVNCALLL